MPENETPAASAEQTSTDVEPVNGPRSDKSVAPSVGDDSSEAPEESNQSQAPDDPRPFNEGQPEQPDASG